MSSNPKMRSELIQNSQGAKWYPNISPLKKKQQQQHIKNQMTAHYTHKLLFYMRLPYFQKVWKSAFTLMDDIRCHLDASQFKAVHFLAAGTAGSVYSACFGSRSIYQTGWFSNDMNKVTCLYRIREIAACKHWVSHMTQTYLLTMQSEKWHVSFLFNFSAV